MTRIGIAGAGRMGSAFAQRLSSMGQEVVLWNRASPRLLHQDGVSTDLKDLADCSIILFSLTDHLAVAEVIAALVDHGLQGKLIVDLSTHAPDAAEALSKTAHALGAAYLECPVGGTVAPALKGQLLGFAGGDAEDLAKARPVLELLCRRIAHMGPVGAGARMKLAVNLPLALYWQSLGEALALLKGSAIDPALALELIGESSAGPNVLKTRASVVLAALTGEDPPGSFDLNGLSKDLHLALDLAAGQGGELPLARRVAREYAKAIEAGLGGADGACLTRLARGS